MIEGNDAYAVIMRFFQRAAQTAMICFEFAIATTYINLMLLFRRRISRNHPAWKYTRRIVEDDTVELLGMPLDLIIAAVLAFVLVAVVKTVVK